jgi:hypothetical protein
VSKTEEPPKPRLLLATATSRAVETTRSGKTIIVIEHLTADALGGIRWLEVAAYYPGQMAPWGDPRNLCDLLLHGERPKEDGT